MPAEKDRVINLFAQMTEAEWAYSAQVFFEKITPAWFTWLGWTFATGSVAFLAEKTASPQLEVIETISYFLLTFYYLYFFASIRIEPYHTWAITRPSNWKKIFAVLPIFILTVGLTFITREIINHVIESVKLAN